MSWLSSALAKVGISKDRQRALTDDVRKTAADATFNAAVGAGTKAAAEIAPPGNKYQTALPFLESPEKRNALYIGAAVFVVLLLLLLLKRR